MFVGRKKELKRLNDMYQSGKTEFAVIYGRRRVGKTTLINEFCKDKPTVFFAAMENSAGMNLEALSASVSETAGETNAGFIYRSFHDAFTKIEEMAKDRRLIFVIDEFPYLAKAEPGISSLLQNFLDHQFKDTGLFLILCGSSMSFMENQVLGYQSPLYGRRTAQFKLKPFDYLEAGEWFPDYSFEEKALMYGITGGIPLYLEQFSKDRSIRENLLDAFFNENAMLFEEPSNLIKQELREPSTYNAILTAIADGKSKFSEISSTTGLESGPCSRFLDHLISLGIVKKEKPITEKTSKRSIYELDDLFFRFWYSFVPGNMAAIVSGRMENCYDQAVKNRLSNYMGKVFEKMCRDYILYYEPDLPFALKEIGQWWGGNPRTKKQAQLDIAATSFDGESILVGSCKFRNEKTGEKELELTKDYALAMGGFQKCFCELFSKSGFTESLLKMQSDQVRLFTLDDLYQTP